MKKYFVRYEGETLQDAFDAFCDLQFSHVLENKKEVLDDALKATPLSGIAGVYSVEVKKEKMPKRSRNTKK